jgi:trehalose 6-phosphate phosphatase
MTATPPAFPLAEIALFLDFDGTLVELAPQPDAVVVPPDLPPLLQRLETALQGALATVSGRPIAEIDAYLAPARLAASGAHGAELRAAGGEAVRVVGERLPEDLRVALNAIVADLGRRWPGLRTEDKGTSFAVHYRHAPAAAPALSKALATLPLGDRWQLLGGHCVYELKARSRSKADAVRDLMAEPAFAGRRPIFLGDDVTDLDGMAAAAALGGAGIAVGGIAADVEWRLANPAAVKAWLRDLVG